MEDIIVKLARQLEYEVDGWVQFNKCNAYVSDILRDQYRLVKSYHTIVGLVDCENKKFFEIGKYSRTTSKQITQIYNRMFSTFDREYIDGRV